MDKVYRTNIEKKTLSNSDYRRVLFTTPQMQLVVMSIDDDIPLEVHPHTTQFIRVESGKGVLMQPVTDPGRPPKTTRLCDGVAVVIPPGTFHYIQNTSETEPLKLYTLYSPPEHPRGQ